MKKFQKTKQQKIIWFSFVALLASSCFGYLEKTSNTDNSSEPNLAQPSIQNPLPIKEPNSEINEASKLLEDNYVNNDPNKQQMNYLPVKKTNIHQAQAYPSNLQTTFTDLFDRKLINGKYNINQNEIDVQTPRVQYNVLNKVFTTSKNGVSFNNWDFAGNNPEEYDTPVALNSRKTVPNDTYRKILRYSVSFTFYNSYKNFKLGKQNFSDDSGDLKIGYNSGTGWILDYQLPTKNQKYPTTWYYGTNLHVARALSSEQSYNPYQYNPKTNIITEQTILRYYPVGTNEHFNSLGPVGSGASYGLNSSRFDTIIKDAKLLYTGLDFLKSKPHDFFPTVFQPEWEEFADFAVVEITFPDEATAQDTTQNYYNETQKYLLRKASYLTEQTTKWKDPIFYSAGFPTLDIQLQEIATNKNPAENGVHFPDLSAEIQNQGSPFANVKNLSSFSNYEGINDALLGLNNLPIAYWGQKMLFSGLVYAIRHDAMGRGSSGSVVINNKNEIVAVHFADWDKSDVGLSTALKSERFLYNNIPNYYLPDYDLIYGGGLDQKYSYKQALFKAYANKGGVKTYLFPEGK